MKVLWSDGTMENCKYGIRGQYDVKVLDDQSIDSREIRVGSIVTRGIVGYFILLITFAFIF